MAATDSTSPRCGLLPASRRHSCHSLPVFCRICCRHSCRPCADIPVVHLPTFLPFLCRHSCGSWADIPTIDRPPSIEGPQVFPLNKVISGIGWLQFQRYEVWVWFFCRQSCGSSAVSFAVLLLPCLTGAGPIPGPLRFSVLAQLLHPGGTAACASRCNASNLKSHQTEVCGCCCEALNPKP
jgi:hypothetical protein